jgi:enoyl-CoA hydratase/carnithine racemase
MSTLDASPSNNGRGSEAWSGSWTHFGVDRRRPGYCRVTFDHPPINTITATTVAELAELVDLIEEDEDLNVIVFDSANPDFYLDHYDVEHDASTRAALPAGPTGMDAWLDVLVRLSRASVVSIASIRGRARGAGSEFVLGCDLRFASRENTLLGQFEVGTGVVTKGGSMARLSRVVGRGRALEILLVADDLDGPRAEQYGYVNRVIAERPALRRGRPDRLTTCAFRSRRDRAHQVLRRPGHFARPRRFLRAAQAPAQQAQLAPPRGARAYWRALTDQSGSRGSNRSTHRARQAGGSQGSPK